ncbi:MAG: hypothetical protein IPG92_15410 [Flavobacteriales bacterium]|nr:hypothetical protein [Flavobacteriales bacterium]
MIDETTGAFATDYSEIDVYDGTSDDWSVGQLPYDLLLHSTNVLDGQIILVAGGGTITGSTFSCTMRYGSGKMVADLWWALMT